uniref:Molybdopterin synthase catalytic subunit n=1 Tax=Neogobius melanostomus TaxID=47308 RepID=A0A8C6SKI3_9GOBI
MAQSELCKLSRIIRERWPRVTHICVHHRLGWVAVGEASVAVAISAPHRRDSEEAVQFCVTRLKASVPIWKKEVFEDRGFRWNENAECSWSRKHHRTAPLLRKALDHSTAPPAGERPWTTAQRPLLEERPWTTAQRPLLEEALDHSTAPLLEERPWITAQLPLLEERPWTTAQHPLLEERPWVTAQRPLLEERPWTTAQRPCWRRGPGPQHSAPCWRRGPGPQHSSPCWRRGHGPQHSAPAGGDTEML